MVVIEKKRENILGFVSCTRFMVNVRGFSSAHNAGSCRGGDVLGVLVPLSC